MERESFLFKQFLLSSKSWSPSWCCTLQENVSFHIYPGIPGSFLTITIPKFFPKRLLISPHVLSPIQKPFNSFHFTPNIRYSLPSKKETFERKSHNLKYPQAFWQLDNIPENPFISCNVPFWIWFSGRFHIEGNIS